MHMHGKGTSRLEIFLADLVPRACRSWVAMVVSGWLVALAVSDPQGSRV